MLNDLSPVVRGLILDMDGVLWKDFTPIGDLARIFATIRSKGLMVMLATNNATITAEEYAQKLARLNVRLESSEIITSSDATAGTLLQAFPQKGSIYVVGENGVTAALCKAGFEAVTDPGTDLPVLAVVVGLDRALTYDKLRRAMFHIRAGARFYGTNPDKTFPTPAGLVPGAGAILAALNAATGVEPIVIGKPSAFMFKQCAARMNLAMQEILVVGDRLETDIAGGQAVGTRTALVLSGVSTGTQADQWQPKPDVIARDLATLVGA